MYNANISSADALFITNCTFSTNQAGSGLGIFNSDSTLAITNCILWGDVLPSGKEIVNTYSTCTISYSDIQGCGGSGSGWQNSFGNDGGGNIDEVPQFLSGSDFRLDSGSPCIDAGNGVKALRKDIDGNKRYDNKEVPNGALAIELPVDIGAFERQRN